MKHYPSPPPHHSVHGPKRHAHGSIENRIVEMVNMKLPTAEVRQLVITLAESHGVELPEGESDLRTMAAELDRVRQLKREAEFQAVLAKAGPTTHLLVAGQCPPPLLGEFLEHSMKITQLHVLHHGAPPPHVGHLERRWAKYKFVDQIEQLVEATFSDVVVHAYERDGQWLVAPLAALASRLWHQLPLIVVRASHPAPHHRVGLDDRSIALFIEE